MDYHQRIQLLQKKLKDQSCDAILIEDQTSMYYLTGLDLSAGKLLVHANGADLFVDNRYLELCLKCSPIPVHLLNPDFARQLSEPAFSFIVKLGFDASTTLFSTYQQYGKFVNINSICSLTPLESPLQAQRMIKDSEEIEILRQAADLGSKGYDYVCSLLKEGVTEADVASELEIFWKKRGGKKTAFDPIIAFGKNSSMPHYRAGDAKLQKDQVVLIDIGVTFKHYHSDMTRTVFFGNPDPQMLILYEIVKQAQQKALDICRPGTTIGDLDSAARNYIADKGYGPNFTHSLGHGVGLDIHEHPFIRHSVPSNPTPLVPGMVVTIEPGIYIPDLGGIRIEDTVVITKDGHENLTKRSTELNVF